MGRFGAASCCVIVLGVVGSAAAQCPGPGDCCAANGTPGCDDESCCQKVCLTDPFCCDVAWDSLCASVAGDTCPVCGAGCPGSGNCCAANGTPGCDDAFCCSLVCVGDPFCCDTDWDAACALQATGLCTACQGGCPGGGDCCTFNGTPGCDNELCCEDVCTVDSFCCTSLWDALCAELAGKLCPPCAPEPVDGDIDGDGVVGIVDFTMLLGAWGSCNECAACPADFDGDCGVGVEDFLFLLGHWS